MNNDIHNNYFLLCICYGNLIKCLNVNLKKNIKNMATRLTVVPVGKLNFSNEKNMKIRASSVQKLCLNNHIYLSMHIYNKIRCK